MNQMQELENARMVASLLGLEDETAAEMLDATIQVVWAEADGAGAALGKFVCQLLCRTFRCVGDPSNALDSAQVALLINGAEPLGQSDTTLHCYLGSTFHCGLSQPAERIFPREVPEILCLLSACFAAAQVANYALKLPRGRVSPSGVAIDFAIWPGVDTDTWYREVDVGKMQFAGAGAVGNAVLFALQFLPVRIRGTLIDPKKVAAGILNRCLLFQECDIGENKASALSKNVSRPGSNIALAPLVCTLSQSRKLHNDFNCLVVGVDSRAGRRQIQEELPREVFDASTTGIDEVVFHHNQLSVAGACLACIYKETAAESDFAEHVAEMLNVSVDAVREEFISLSAAIKICERYRELNHADLLGKSYTTIFRQQCATEKLTTPEEKQVLAPFAFVSQLAGTVLAVEIFLRRLHPPRSREFNYWRINPWRGISVELQGYRLPLPDCEVCSKPEYHEVAKYYKV